MSPVTTFGRATCLALLISTLLAAAASATTVGREQDIVDLKLGQRVQVDDGTCPAGQIKEVRGAKMSDKGVVRTASCVARFGPKSR
jgi:phosphosulfolactate phosphohydrolase-like enzyme